MFIQNNRKTIEKKENTFTNSNQQNTTEKEHIVTKSDNSDEKSVKQNQLPNHNIEKITKQNNNTNKVLSQLINEQEQKLAEMLSALGNILSGDTDTSSTVRGLITSSIGSEFEQWLSQYAVAKVQLSLDKDLSLKNSQLDLLFPLHEEENNLSFIQSSFHRTDNRNQMNLGMGYRWFNDNWMLGGNTFFDYDLSRGHARVGFGLEYSRDFLRLSANSYFRVTDWKASPDLVDYDERPANGWDVRAKAWLPTLPQLGGKLVFEKYYGDEVALFSTSTRSKNPSAITAGVEYSPFPLVTFSVERTQASSNEFNNLFSVEVNYELGVPWAQQIDPATLTKIRSLEHNRYELVDRNNNIILEYKKQTLITIKMAKNITGYPGDIKPLFVVVKSKYGYNASNITVTPNDDLRYNGGALTNTDGNYYVKLPRWNSTGSNIYTVTGSVVDKKGNQSNTAKSQVTVKEVTVSSNSSTFTPQTSSIVANSKDTQVLTLTLKNSSGVLQDISVDDVSLTKDYGTALDATVSDPVKQSTGVFTATVTAGDNEGVVKVTPVAQNVALTDITATVNLTSKVPNENKSSISSSVSGTTESILANGSDYATITVKLVNSEGIPISNAGSALTIGFGSASSLKAAVRAASTDGAKIGNITDNGDGSYTAKMTATAAGTYTVIPKYNEVQIGSLNVKVKAVAAPSTANSTFAVTSPINANGTDESTLTVSMKDYSGAAIDVDSSKIIITIYNSSGTAVSTPTLSSTSTTGVYTATFKTSTSGTYSAKATYGGSAVGSTQTITANAVVSVNNSTISVNPSSIEANGSATSTITIAMKDYASNAIAVTDSDNIIITVTNDSTGTSETKSVAASSITGSYTASFKTAIAGSYSVTATYNGSSIGTGEFSSKTINASAAVSASNSTLAASSATIDADGSSSSIITVTLKDYNNANVAGSISNIKLMDATTNTTLTPVASSSTGVYTYEFKTTVSGAHSITATYGGTAISGSPSSITATAVVSESKSTFTPASSSIAADGTSTATLTLTLFDYAGKAITASSVSIAPSDDNGGTITTETTENKTIATFKSTTKAGTYTVTATIVANGKTTTKTVSVTTTAGIDWASSTLTPASSEVAADGTTSVKLTVNVVDYAGNAIDTANTTDITLSYVGKTDTTSKSLSVTKGSTGTYTAIFPATTVADTYTVTAKYTGSSSNKTATIVTGSSVDWASSTLTPVSSSIAADGTATVTLTVNVVDYAGNAIDTTNTTDITLSYVGKTDTTSKSLTVTKESTGTYTATFPATTTADTYTVTAKYTGSSSNKTATIKTNATVNWASSTFNAAASSIMANGTDSTKLTLTMKDYAGSNIQVDSTKIVITATTTGATVDSSITDNSDGTYSVNLTTTYVGDNTVTASYDNNTAKSVKVTGTKQIPISANSSIVVNKSSYNVGDRVDVTVTLKDKNSVAITGQKSLMSTYVTIPNVTKGSYIWTETSKGVYVLYNTASTAGTSLTATVDLTGFGGTGNLTSGTYSIVQTISPTNSSFTAADGSIIANNSDKKTLTLVLKDAVGTVITGKASSLTTTVTTSDGTTSQVTVSGFTEDSSTKGTYTATFLASTTGAGTYSIVPNYNGSAISGLSASVTATLQTINTTYSTINSTSPSSVSANGSDIVTLNYTLRDDSNVLIPSTRTAYSTVVDGDGQTIVNRTTNTDGTRVITVNTTTSGTNTVTVVLKDASSNDMTPSFALTYQAKAVVSPSNSTLEVGSASIAANGSSTSTITLTLLDYAGNAITATDSSTISISTNNTAYGTVTIDSTSANVTKATLKSTTAAGVNTITAKADGITITATPTITTVATVDISQSTFETSTGSVLVNNYDTATLTVTLKDYSGAVMTSDELANVTIEFSTTTTGAKLTTLTKGTTNGTYIKTISMQTVGTYTLIAKYSGTEINTVSVVGEAQTPSTGSSITAGDVSILDDGTAQAQLIAVLVDSSGQPIKGASNSQLSFAISPTSGATLNSFTGGSDGTYYTTITATTSATYTVTVVYNGVTYSNLYVSVAMQLASAYKSTITTDAKSYAVDDTITVTVVLNNAVGNPITGKTSLLTSTVTVNNATSSGDWTESSTKGTYTRTYTATTANTRNYATLVIRSTRNSSAAYSIVIPTLSNVTDGNSKDYTTTEGFPTTGFSGAQFTLNLSSGTASNYVWSSSASWAPVSNGVVTFSGTGTSSSVTITAKRPNGDTLFTYSFTLKYWFINYGKATTESEKNTNASMYCLFKKASLPTVAQLNGSGEATGIRGVNGSLWGEWGNLDSYTSSNFTAGGAHFSSENLSSSQSYYVYTGSGGTRSGGTRAAGGTFAQTACITNF